MPKYSKKLSLKGVWIELESKTCFQRQSFKKYLRLTLVYMRNSTQREMSNFVVQEFLASVNKIFILAGRLDTRLFFYEVLRPS